MKNQLLQFFKNHALPLTWQSLIVGRKLKLASHDFIEAYATEYLMVNPLEKCLDSNELAYGIPDTYQGNILINELLEKITVRLKLEIPQERSPLWFHEARKWRFMLLKKAFIEITDEQKLQEKIEDIYCKFEHPENLEQLCEHNALPPTEEYKNLMLSERLSLFLHKELESIQ
jgi:hypothetical protein